jgi:hypothetical protein
LQLQGVKAMTIFIDVLKQLIKEDLSGAISEELRKSRAYGHNHKLSLQQKEILTDLDTAIILFNSTGNDKSDSEKIGFLITSAREAIQKIREEHHQSANGQTMECLNRLTFSTQNFYKKLEEFAKLVITEASTKSESITDVACITLLNKPYQRTPEHIIYYHSCYYFGQEIFHPESTDLEIRAKKEAKLAIRLQSLSEIIKEGFTLEQQRLRALQIIKDLLDDNLKVTKRVTSGPAMPGLSFFGFQLTSAPDWFSASQGRFGEQFKVAGMKIAALTVETSDCPKPKVVAKVLVEEHVEIDEDQTERHTSTL